MNIYIHLLEEILNKKKIVLKRILEETKTQKKLLQSSQTVDVLEKFQGVSLKKQEEIEEILALDEVFNRTFEKIEDFEEIAKEYKKDILSLQHLIKNITDIDIEIRLIEKENEALLAQRDERKITPKVTYDLLKQYDKMNRENLLD